MNTTECILFDLDGTLLDTSYDFAYALNRTLSDFGRPQLRYQDIRKTVSQGGLAMTKLAFPELEGDELEQKRQHFLEIYHDNIANHTQLFPGLMPGLKFLAEHNIPWGIVTNKPGWLTEKLLSNFSFPSTPLTVISGDTLEVRKPHPEPMYLAAEQCGVAPENCLYLGDHPRDIEAGINAGMKTGAALFGYLPESADDNSWPADYFFATPYEISQFLQNMNATHHTQKPE
ncbi:HAD family hydrolase [Thiomicrorhabdus sp.]|uniref:HAD family hydrolase n=1 Tax=Thiomicrorhabdus sp. TaxID=2039724 RepID=UPI0035662693